MTVIKKKKNHCCLDPEISLQEDIAPGYSRVRRLWLCSLLSTEWAKELEQVWITVLNLAAIIEQGGTSVPSRGKLMQKERLRFLHQNNLLGGLFRPKSSLDHWHLFMHSLSKCSWLKIWGSLGPSESLLF